MSIDSDIKETTPDTNGPEEGHTPFTPQSPAEKAVYQAAKVAGIAVGDAARTRILLDDHIEKAHYKETHDPLTGLYNLEGLNEQYEKMKAESSKYPIGVVMIDLGRFKKINDTHGHDYGDEVLVGFADRVKEFADRLRSSLRTNDPDDPESDKIGMIASRRSGDEFIVLARLGPSTTTSGLEPDTTDRRAVDLTPEQRLAGLELRIRVIGQNMRDGNETLQGVNFSAVTGGAIVTGSLGDGLKRADQELLENKPIDHAVNGPSR